MPIPTLQEIHDETEILKNYVAKLKRFRYSQNGVDSRKSIQLQIAALEETKPVSAYHAWWNQDEDQGDMFWDSLSRYFRSPRGHIKAALSWKFGIPCQVERPSLEWKRTINYEVNQHDIAKRMLKLRRSIKTGSVFGDLTVVDDPLWECEGNFGGIDEFATAHSDIWELYKEDDFDTSKCDATKVWVTCKCSCGVLVPAVISQLRNGQRVSCNKRSRRRHGWRKQREEAKIAKDLLHASPKVSTANLIKIYRDIGQNYWNTVVSGAKTRELEFSITPNYAWDVWVQQHGKCVFTGVDLTFKAKGVAQTASLDRIDSSKGYVEGNVQWVDKNINMLKTSNSDSRFIEMCAAVTSYQQPKLTPPLDKVTT